MDIATIMLPFGFLTGGSALPQTWHTRAVALGIGAAVAVGIGAVVAAVAAVAVGIGAVVAAVAAVASLSRP
jgi:hypothetical protein